MSHDHDEPYMTIPNPHIPWTRAGAFAARASFSCCQRFPRPFGGGISIGPHSASTCTQKKASNERRRNAATRDIALWGTNLFCAGRGRALTALTVMIVARCATIWHYLSAFAGSSSKVHQNCHKMRAKTEYLTSVARKNGIF